MPSILLPLIFLFGIVFGSFLNVCIYRIPRDLSVVTPRSFCPECGNQLAWIENIPLISYIFLRGRCRRCSKPVGLRYPLVEALAGILLVLIASQYGLTLAALKWGLFEMLLIVLFWTDLEERLLPDELTLGGALIGLIFAAIVALPGGLADAILPEATVVWQSLLNALLGAALLAFPVWLIGAAYGRLRKRDALGLGDVKLLIMLGIFLGPEEGLKALIIGAVAGAILGITLLMRFNGKARFYELPFGSFLCFAAALIPVWHPMTTFLLDVL